MVQWRTGTHQLQILQMIQFLLALCEVDISDKSEPSWIFSSVRLGLWAFFTLAWNRKLAKNELKFNSQLKTYFWLFFIINLYWKWLNYAARSYYWTLKTPFVLICLDKWSWNWLRSCYRSKIGKFDIHTVSSVSARELKCPSLARLRTFIAWLRSSRKIPAQTHHETKYVCIWNVATISKFSHKLNTYVFWKRKTFTVLVDGNRPHYDKRTLSWWTEIKKM